MPALDEATKARTTREAETRDTLEESERATGANTTAGEQHVGAVADVLDDGKLIRRGVTIRRSVDEVRAAWNAAGIQGDAVFAEAPGDLGTEVRVTAPGDRQNALKEIVNAWKSDDPGESLSTQLRKFKAQLETGEVATVIGQPSGREAIDE
jgi:hypothetical protein